MSSVYAMVKQVLADSKEKLAAQQNNSVGRAVSSFTQEKKAQAVPRNEGNPEAEKVAAALDYVADNLGLLVDTRSAQEKLAEYAAISEALAKSAEEDQGPHQTQEAPESFQPPMDPVLAGPQMGAGGNQLENYEAIDGAPVLEPGESGEAPDSIQPPMGTEPGESAYPGDEAANALETNSSDAPGGAGEAPEKIARARAIKLAQMVSSGQITEKTAAVIIANDHRKMAAIKVQQGKKFALGTSGKQIPSPRKSVGKSKKAAKSLSVKNARDLIRKLAEDALNPAQISAGTMPELQTAEGANPAQMQGTPAGEGVPDTKGSDQGREGISSIMAAINATKNDLKGNRTRSEMSNYLNTPALDSSSDSVLQQSLENASSAGVKIAATKSMLQKWANSSPERQERLKSVISKVKKANEMMGYGAGAPPALPMTADAAGGAQVPPVTAAMPGMAASGGPKQAMGGPDIEPVSDAALAAAAQGVLPEELERAEMLLQEQMGGGEVPPEYMGEMPQQIGPPAGEEEVPTPPSA